MNLRTIGMAAVAALSLAGRAEAQDAAAAPAAGGWDTKYGILFTVPNPFGGGSGRDVVNSYDGMVGFQYNLGPQAGIRIGANLLRKSCGDFEYTDDLNVTFKGPCTDITSTFVPPGGIAVQPGFNSEYGLKLSAEYLMRATTADVSPYFGAGASINFDRKGLSGTYSNSAPGSVKDEFKNSETEFGLGVVGKFGLEYRIHKVIALFAEYQLDIPLVTRKAFKYEESVTGSPTVKADGKQTDIFNLSTGISHAGLLGVVAYF